MEWRARVTGNRVMSESLQRTAFAPSTGAGNTVPPSRPETWAGLRGQAELLHDRTHRRVTWADLPAAAPPRHLPHACLPRLDVAGVCRQSSSVGGDFYDILDVRGELTIAVGDVAGKGWGASVLMTAVRASLRTHLAQRVGLRQVVSLVNRDLVRDSRDCEFATFFIGTIDPLTLRLTYCSAGQPALLIRDGLCSGLDTAGLPIGIDPAEEYAIGHVDLHRHDMLATFTDGILDARDPRGGLYGEDRTRAFLLRHRHQSARRVCDDFLAEVSRFTGDAPPTDDTTLAIVKVR